MIFADCLQVVETTCIKLIDTNSCQSNCIKPIDNLLADLLSPSQSIRYERILISSMQQMCCNVRVSGRVEFYENFCRLRTILAIKILYFLLKSKEDEHTIESINAILSHLASNVAINSFILITVTFHKIF